MIFIFSCKYQRSVASTKNLDLQYHTLAVAQGLATRYACQQQIEELNVIALSTL